MAGLLDLLAPIIGALGGGNKAPSQPQIQQTYAPDPRALFGSMSGNSMGSGNRLDTSGMSALDVAALTPSDTPSNNDYGYQSVLNDPKYSAEAMGGTGQAPAAPGGNVGEPQAPSFFETLLSGVGKAAPQILKGILMQKAMNDNGGVKGRMTGLTFGARPMEQNPAYQRMIMEQQQAAAQKQMAQQFEYDLAKKQMEHGYEMDKVAFTKRLDFQAGIAGDMRSALNEMFKDGTIDMKRTDANAVAAAMAGDVNSMMVVLQQNPNAEAQIKEAGLAAFTAASEIEDPADRNAFLEDPINGALIGFAGLGPDAETLYTTRHTDARNAADRASRDANAAASRAVSMRGQNMTDARGRAGQAATERRWQESKKIRAAERAEDASAPAAASKPGKSNAKVVNKKVPGGEVVYRQDEAGEPIEGTIAFVPIDDFAGAGEAVPLTVNDMVTRGMWPKMPGAGTMEPARPADSSPVTEDDLVW